MWLYTILAMIGENFDAGHELCGAVIRCTLISSPLKSVFCHPLLTTTTLIRYVQEMLLPKVADAALLCVRCWWPVTETLFCSLTVLSARVSVGITQPAQGRRQGGGVDQDCGRQNCMHGDWEAVPGRY